MAKKITAEPMAEAPEEIPFDSAGPSAVAYDEDSIQHLEDMDHVRTRPGMYIGRLGDGSHAEDGIYVLLKEVVDNSIDEFRMGQGKRIDIDAVEEGRGMCVRDYGRGIPQGKLIEAVSQLNTGGKYDTKVFKKSVGLNGVGLKAVNALSHHFEAASYRDGKVRRVVFEKGKLKSDETNDTSEGNGTEILFVPDETLFVNYAFHSEFVTEKLRNYTYLNSGLSVYYNGKHIVSRNGLEDLLNDNLTADKLYDIVHLKGDGIEIAFTHTNQYGEEYYSFVNGQHTTQGGTHQSAFKEHIARTIKEYFGKNMDYQDVRNGIVAAIALDVEEPVFESQTKIKLGSQTMSPGGISINKFVGDFIKENLDNFLHRELGIAEILLEKIQRSERERKELAGLTKKSRENAKKVSLNNSKLRDCHVHYNDAKGDKREDSCIFITEGLSASGSITKSRDVTTQAVFSLRGKPLNTYGLTKKTIYDNEEFSLLQAALNIESGLEGLRYNKIIVATDADVDGMHIRLLMITFFLQFFPDLIKKGHVFILQTPLFRVRRLKKGTKKSSTKDKGGIDENAAGAAILKGQKGNTRSEYETRYCYSEQERVRAIEDLGPNPEITRFKGLGEINAEEFKYFIGPDIRLEQVTLHKDDQVNNLLSYYMGKNTMERQNFIIDNLVVEEDRPEEDFVEG